MPTFTILLPAKGRPELVVDAITSIIGQTFGDFEVIFSNNGADPLVREAIRPFLHDPRVRYFEQPRVLPMPEHWETISLHSRGRYQIVVPDRSLLCHDALEKIAALHATGTDEAKIVSWTWDLYHVRSRMLESIGGVRGESVILDSDIVALSWLSTDNIYPTALPRGLNSSVSTSIVEEIRGRIGCAFATLNPDFTFAYCCLMTRPRFIHLPQALSISQGLDVSNGGNAYRSDATAYLSTLGLKKAIRHSPIDAPLVENIIAEDFFAACHRFDRLDLIERIDRSAFYVKCLEEWQVKCEASILTPSTLVELRQAIQS
ncbi:MAG: glycosyltransferase family 2 protein, partial [Roseovarius sp.]